MAKRKAGYNFEKLLKRSKTFGIADEKLLRVVRFLAKFTLFAILLYIILISRWTLVELQQLTLNLSVSIMQAIGIDATVNNFVVSIPINNGFWGAVINWDCTGWKSMLAFFALVMSTELAPRRKIYGMLLIPVIYLVNIVRIVFMFFYVTVFDLANYQVIHSIVWSWGLIATILVLWIIWLKYDFTRLNVEKWFRQKKRRT
jgi:exosortase/archaeosortase family protein